MSVHIAIVREVVPGREAEFEDAIRAFLQESLSEPGTERVHLLVPAAGSEKREYGILRSFRDEAAMKAFYASERFARWQERIAPLVVGEPVRRRLHGLEGFFRGPASPPRWKMALLTWLGVFAAVFTWSRTLGSFVHSRVPPALATAIDTAVVVTVLAWGLMPLLTRVFHKWLHPELKQ